MPTPSGVNDTGGLTEIDTVAAALVGLAVEREAVAAESPRAPVST